MGDIVFHSLVKFWTMFRENYITIIIVIILNDIPKYEIILLL